MDIEHIEHVDTAIVESYRKLRTRMGLITLIFPVVLIAVGYFWGLELQPTLSNYYYAMDPVGQRIDAFPVRLWFCGILFAVGVFLFKYQGFSKNEDRWLSFAGVFALGVAVFPMSFHDHSDWDWLLAPIGLRQLSLHGICAVLAFACVALVIFWYSESTLSELKKPNPTAYKWFKRAYVAIAAYMALSIAAAVYLHYANHGKGSYILFAEWSGIWAFAGYWFVKNWELSKVAKVMKARNRALPQRTEADIADKI